MNPGDMELNTKSIARFLRECHWMRRSKDWKERLLFRLAKLCLDLLTQRALAEGQEPEGKWQKKITK